MAEGTSVRENRQDSSVPENRLDFGKLQYGCEHYRRRCRIRAPCCNRIFTCRHCHNDAMVCVLFFLLLSMFLNPLILILAILMSYAASSLSDPMERHELVRQDVTRVAKVCSNCGVDMGEYFCEVCKFYDDETDKKQFHCNECGICRVGGRENFFHCQKCGMRSYPFLSSGYLRVNLLWITLYILCPFWDFILSLRVREKVEWLLASQHEGKASCHIGYLDLSLDRGTGSCYSVSIRDNHLCVENAMKNCCPICYEYLFDSVKGTTVMRCGHTIHLECYYDMLKQKQYRCPICSKSTVDMSRNWERLDEELLPCLQSVDMRNYDYCKLREQIDVICSYRSTYGYVGPFLRLSDLKPIRLIYVTRTLGQDSLPRVLSWLLPNGEDIGRKGGMISV
ncbi:hypothetical protein Cgig2_002603 [Carnegiea gigantea]|uniref:Uncharacterized protein n=1 Tax=Carnegiea gigantea TaxID=171969 RepID=A0A9Q1QAL4_9CARY|nr:hypothetical protein Cgig2_002603 [Carnegiea gigantea]